MFRNARDRFGVASLGLLAILMVGLAADPAVADEPAWSEIEVTAVGAPVAMDLHHLSHGYVAEVYEPGNNSVPARTTPIILGKPTPIDLRGIGSVAITLCVAPSLPLDQPYARWCFGDAPNVSSATPIVRGAEPSSVTANLAVVTGYHGPRLRGRQIAGQVDSASHGYPRLTAPLRAGTTLHVNRLSWSSAADGSETGVRETFQWERDNDPIAGARDRTFALTSRDVGHAIWVSVTGSRPDRASTTVWLYVGTISGRLVTMRSAPTILTLHSDESHYVFSVRVPPKYTASSVKPRYTWYVGGVVAAHGSVFRTSKRGYVELTVGGTRSGGYEVTTSPMRLIRGSIDPPVIFREASNGPVGSPTRQDSSPPLRVGKRAEVMSGWYFDGAYQRDIVVSTITYEWQFSRAGGWVTFARTRTGGDGVGFSRVASVPKAAAGRTLRVIARAHSASAIHGTAVLTGGRVRG